MKRWLSVCELSISTTVSARVEASASPAKSAGAAARRRPGDAIARKIPPTPTARRGKRSWSSITRPSRSTSAIAG
jgi:hypothetical protein